MKGGDRGVGAWLGASRWGPWQMPAAGEQSARIIATMQHQVPQWDDMQRRSGYQIYA